MKNHRELENQGWESMQKILDREMPVKKRRGAIWWWSGISIATILILLFFLPRSGSDFPTSGDPILEASKSTVPTEKMQDLNARDEIRLVEEIEDSHSPSLQKPIVENHSSDEAKLGLALSKTLTNVIADFGVDAATLVEPDLEKQRIASDETGVNADLESTSEIEEIEEQEELRNSLPIPSESVATENTEAVLQNTEAIDADKEARKYDRFESLAAISWPLLARTSRELDFPIQVAADQRSWAFHPEVFGGLGFGWGSGNMGYEAGLLGFVGKGKWGFGTGISFLNMAASDVRYSATVESLEKDQVFASQCPCLEMEDASFVQAGNRTDLLEFSTDGRHRFWRIPLMVSFAPTGRWSFLGGVSYARRTDISFSRADQLEAVVTYAPGMQDVTDLSSSEQELFRSSNFFTHGAVRYRVNRLFLELEGSIGLTSHLNFEAQSLDANASGNVSSNPFNRMQIRVGYRF